MSQSRRNSMIETVAGAVVAFIISVSMSMVVYPLFGHSFSLGENVGITIIFTVVSLVRSYLWRRAANRFLA